MRRKGISFGAAVRAWEIRMRRSFFLLFLILLPAASLAPGAQAGEYCTSLLHAGCPGSFCYSAEPTPPQHRRDCDTYVANLTWDGGGLPDVTLP